MRGLLKRVLRFRVGDLVEVRSEREIIATLDAEGRLDGLPFMPEMLKYCGKRFRVSASAHKTCDTIKGTDGRRMQRAVHLENLRCDGASHGGCQARCLLFWKEEWVRPVGQPETPRGSVSEASVQAEECCTRDALWGATRLAQHEATDEVFACQATELFRATAPLRWWDIRQYIRDLASGNVRLGRLMRVVLVATFNAVQRKRRGTTYPRPIVGTRTKTPRQTLGLQAGDRVQVRRREEIAETLDLNARNRGLRFDIEMVPFCGRTFTVLHRVERIINERTGKMMELPGDCVILDGVSCSSELSSGRLFCPRRIYSYWREIWLKRSPTGISTGGSADGESTARHEGSAGLAHRADPGC